jgi:anaerobic magnesium-protoporphyrin IX monomethyl ester cyclase
VILLYNPLSTTPGKQPLPLSLMSLAAVLEAQSGEEKTWTLVDGNLTSDPASDIVARLGTVPDGHPALLAVTVMPGPQLSQAVPVCRAIRERMPRVPIVWGGYFPTQHADTVLRASYVDFVVRSQGEGPLLQLVDALAGRLPFERVSGLSWKDAGGRAVHNPVGVPIPPDELPDLPYERVDMSEYIHPSYLGQRTVAHNSSFGCPFACSFCAVVAMSNRRWLAQSPARVERVVRHLVSRYGVDAVQMQDMDFFISEARVLEIAERITDLGVNWWALGRVDTLLQYADTTWRAMARSGLKMLFSGAESASDATLAAMNKGGQAAAGQPLELAKRMRSFGVVPEFSFVLGSPPDPLGDMARTFELIRAIKRVNPAAEIILYTYTPVPMEGSPLFDDAARLGFAFPRTLEEWASDSWRQLSLRRGRGLPWIQERVRRRVRNFERVLNAFYPTVTDCRLTRTRRALLRTISRPRYAMQWYGAPYELRLLQRLFKYQRPETTGF